MKNIYKKFAVCLLSLCSFAMLTSCGNKAITTPQDAIVDSFGDRQYRISFDSTNLDNPISDIYYTAKNMPVLPTPTKVGYVFAGWYFDPTYTELCNVEDGDLFWKMKNLTLYAKWNVEEIVNNGQYDIEYKATIDENSIIMGALASKYDYYKFPDDIIDYGTYIEKNDDGIFLRIQYDSRTRGPVLGGEAANEDNFSKQTYTITDPNNRISEKLSIFDRTSTLQTLYYNIEGLKLDETITLYVEYYNWVDPMPEADRALATVHYKVNFNITRFIGFGASFINPEARLEDGIYSIPTHYCGLDKSISMLDMFNPVNSYIKASKGTYKLYKPMSAYNNDFPKMTEKHYPLRTTGFARELTYFLVDKDVVVSKADENDITGKNFIPSLLRAKYLQPITFEFNAKTGQYYYIFDLGKSLNSDIALIGGSSGAMESMFNFPLGYRRLTLDYKSMIRLASWPYEEITGDSYTFKEEFTLYPGFNLDFATNNTDFDHFKTNRSYLNMKNVFYSNKDGNFKLYDCKIKITPLSADNYFSEQRYRYQNFEFQYDVFGYNPETDGILYSRDLTYSTHTLLQFSNSIEKENYNGKTFNVGDHVRLNSIYREKVTSNTTPFEYEAYEVDNLLNVKFDKKVKIDSEFDFERNIAILFKTKIDTYYKTSLVYLVEKQAPKVAIKKGWKLNEETGVITTDKKFEIGTEVYLPEIQYSYYDIGNSTRGIYKNDDSPEDRILDFLHVSLWEYHDGIYTSYKSFVPGETKYDFLMETDRIRALVQLENPFGEFVTYLIEVNGFTGGEYQIKNDEKIIKTGDVRYDKNSRFPVKTEVLETFDIKNEASFDSVTKKFDLIINDNNRVENVTIPLKYAYIYLKDTTLKIDNIANIWQEIKDQPYAIICFTYQNDYGDQVTQKGQFNFMIEGEGVGSFNIVNNNRMYFTDQEVNFTYPFITKNDHKSLSQLPRLKIYQKVGNNFIDNCYHAYTSFDYKLYASVKFHETGDYLLNYQINISTDKDGNKLLDAVDLKDEFSYIVLNISEIIHVVDRISDIEMTYVTDLEHPFDLSSSELIGYDVITKDGKQYATKKFLAGEKIKTPSYKAFKETTSVLYKWGDKNKNKVALPGYYVSEVNTILNTNKPYLYACWDDGINVHVNYEQDGVVHFVKDVFTQKDPNDGNEGYTIDSNLLGILVPRDYVIYGWKSDHNIFFARDPENDMSFYYTNFKKGRLEGFINFSEETSLTAILKKQLSISYNAYDANGNKLKFMNKLSNDYGLFIGDKFINSIDRTKVNALNDVVCTDLSKELLYWEVFDYELQDYVRIDLYDFIMLEKYSNNKVIELRAIFG